MENYRTFFPRTTWNPQPSSQDLGSNDLGYDFLNPSGILSSADQTAMIGALSVETISNSMEAAAVVGPSNSHGSENMKEEKKNKKPKKSRMAFETRSQVDVLDDGYRWRKYGQKAVKNNKFPRNYYKCTYKGCNVKKQVQRQSKDEGIVITTYEGVHNHPIDNPTDNFEQILYQMRIYPPS